MDGRPSMDKAKAIKAKRDLAQELRKLRLGLIFIYPLMQHEICTEDVQSFEQAVVGGPSRKRSRAKSSAREEGAGSVSGGESEGGRSDFSAEAPIKHRVCSPEIITDLVSPMVYLILECSTQEYHGLPWR